MKAPLYNLDGETIGEVELRDEVFGRKWSPELVRQILLAQSANRRQTLAHAKDRSEVRGGGKKPWRQKGTGRARHGSIRSPIWIGGGKAHGPLTEKDYSKRVNKKMRRAAIYVALSQKLRDGELRVVDQIAVSTLKTKELAIKIKNFPSSLLVTQSDNKNIIRVSRNIPKVKNISVQSVNVEDVMKYKNIFIEKKAVEEIK